MSPPMGLPRDLSTFSKAIYTEVKVYTFCTTDTYRVRDVLCAAVAMERLTKFRVSMLLLLLLLINS